MHIHETLFSIELLIIVAKLLEGIFKRFGLNSIIAYAAVGVVSLSMLRYLPRTEWDTTTLTQTLRHKTPTATTEDYIEDALQTMTDNSITILPVIDPETNQSIGSIAAHEALEMVVEDAQGPNYLSLPLSEGELKGVLPGGSNRQTYGIRKPGPRPPNRRAPLVVALRFSTRGCRPPHLPSGIQEGAARAT